MKSSPSWAVLALLAALGVAIAGAGSGTVTDELSWPIVREGGMFDVANTYGQYQQFDPTGGATYHRGVDILAEPCEEVVAIEAGKVVARIDQGRWSGLVIESAPGEAWGYFHLADMTKTACDANDVEKGEKLGAVHVWNAEGYDHLEIKRVRRTDGGTSGGWTNWEPLEHPLEHLPNLDDTPPTILKEHDGHFGYWQNQSSNPLPPDALKGDVDVTARVLDRFRTTSEHDIAPYRVTLEIRTRPTAELVLQRSILLAGPLGDDELMANVVYKQNSGLASSYGSWTDRRFHFVMTNADDDALIAANDKQGCWQTEPGDYLVRVQAFDQGGNASPVVEDEVTVVE